MAKQSIDWPLLASVLLALSVCVYGCRNSDSQKQTPSASVSAPVLASAGGAVRHEVLPATESQARAPIYDLPVTLTDQDGNQIDLHVFRGNPVVISMFYASCPYACPTLISDIKRLERQLDEPTRNRTRVLLVSFDPERDVPTKLKALCRQHKLDEKRWRLTSAPAERVRELAAVLGIKYRPLKDGEFNHSSVISMLDENGKLIARVEGLDQPLEPLLAALASSH